jgi:hypothetical protein
MVKKILFLTIFTSWANLNALENPENNATAHVKEALACFMNFLGSSVKNKERPLIEEKFNELDDALFKPNLSKATRLLQQIPYDYKPHDEGKVKSLLEYVIDAALWYDSSLETNKKMREYLRSFLPYDPSPTKAGALFIAALGSLYLSKGNKYAMVPGFLGLVVSCLTALSYDDGRFTAEGREQMYALVHGFLERMKKSHYEVDAATQEYILRLCREVPQPMIVQGALREFCDVSAI